MTRSTRLDSVSAGVAVALLGDPTLDPTATATGYVTGDVADAAAALEGARAILVERFSEDADLVGGLRERMWSRGRLVSRVREGKEADGAKFADYFDFAEPFTELPSHRVLAMFRGEKEEVLDLTLEPEEAGQEAGPSSFERAIAHRFGIADHGRPADPWLLETVRWAWRTRILVHLGIDTVQLQGEGFELLVAVGDEVTTGTPVVRWDPSAVAAAGRSAVCPVIALDASSGAVERLAGERAEPGTELFRWS